VSALGPGRTDVRCDVKIEFSGTEQEMAVFLGKLQGLMQDVSTTAVVAAESHSAAGPTGRQDGPLWWDPDRAQAFVRTLTPAALLALRLIAERAPAIPVTEIQGEMQRAGLPMTPGRMSSIGFAVRRLGAPPPFTRDAYQGTYHMDQRLAGLFLRASEEEERRRRKGAVKGNGRVQVTTP
jgi:hypothetical protein